MDHDPLTPIDAASERWGDNLDRARADVAAGRIVDIDLDELCAEIEAEAGAMFQIRNASVA